MKLLFKTISKSILRSLFSAHGRTQKHNTAIPPQNFAMDSYARCQLGSINVRFAYARQRMERKLQLRTNIGAYKR